MIIIVKQCHKCQTHAIMNTSKGYEPAINMWV